MPEFSKNDALRTVQPPVSREKAVFWGLLLFGIATTVVYHCGLVRTPLTGRPAYTATAYVVDPGGEQSPDETRIPFAYTNNDPRRAELIVNALADIYVNDRRVECERQTEQSQLKAQQDVELAKNQYAEAQAQLENLRRQLSDSAADPQPTVDRPKESLAMVENPEWIELDRQMKELERQRDELLVERTALHPAVLKAAESIDVLRREMADVPRQIPSRRQEQKNEEQPKQNATQPDKISAQDMWRLNRLEAVAERCRIALQQAEAAQKQTAESVVAVPEYSIVYAQLADNPLPANVGWQRLASISLMAGALMGFGIAAIAAAEGIEPVVAGIGQLQTDLGMPVLGIIPTEEPAFNPQRRCRRQSRIRLALMATGLILIVACPVVAFWGIAGI